MLGLAPDDRGLLPEEDAQRLQEFGQTIAKRYGVNLASKDRVRRDPETESAVDGDPGTFWSAPAGSHNSILEIDLAKPATFDHVLLMERLNNGQHVQAFRVEVWDSSRWQPVVTGNTIGHKRIEEFAPLTASRVRLSILSSTGAAEIREFQLFLVRERPN